MLRLRGTSTKNVEEEWTVVDRDPEDEIFYSTCYRRNPRARSRPRVRRGVLRRGRCGAAAAVALRGALRCDDAAANALPSAVPHWSLATDCEVCHRDDVDAAQPSTAAAGRRRPSRRPPRPRLRRRRRRRRRPPPA